LWMAYATPLVGLAGLGAWKAALKPGLRALIYFYGSVLAVLAWIMVWERFDVFLAGRFQGTERDALLFSYGMEETWRTAVKSFFYGSAFLLGTAYLVGAPRTGVFMKRAFFLGLPSLLLYWNMLFVLGDWNHYLAGIRERSFQAHRFGTYRFASKSHLARTPDAHRIPAILEEWAELEYQSGDREKAISLLRDLSARCRGKPYFAKMGKRADRALAAMEKPPSGQALRLDLPLIKPASYLDQEWYALLSAVAFLKPSWTDLELKKRLLELSNTVQLHLPKLDNIPELIPALGQLDLPAAACFLSTERIKSALAAGHVPFISLYGRWVPISGFDPGRDGFYYYAYDATGGFDWFRNEDTDLFYHNAGEAFGGEAEKAKSRANTYSRRKFVSRLELEEHILDIGGVGLVLGDSAFAPAAERRAAFLLEQGDVHYQDHENYQGAAAAYRQAGALHANDQVWSRMVYLKRRYWESASDPRDYQNLFREYPPPWMERLGPEKAVERDIVAKIMEGRLGSYLMMNWYVAPLPDSTEESKAAMDTALSLFKTLHGMDPDEPLYTDSLASLLARRGDLEGSEKLYQELTGMYPFGSESAVYRLAWTKLRLGKVQELPELLARCRSYGEDARYLTMKAAVSLRKGRYRSAYLTLSRSLKVDKSIGETHALLADYYRHKGDKANMQVHLNWQRRST
jgi:tetratricopeptide (TPR) repeat protein